MTADFKILLCPDLLPNHYAGFGLATSACAQMGRSKRETFAKFSVNQCRNVDTAI